MNSICKKSFITDVIQKSGQLSVKSNYNANYPTISEEFAVKSSPDIVVVNFFDDTRRLRQLFPHSKIIILSKEERDVINRPGPRVYKSVQYFSKLLCRNFFFLIVSSKMSSIEHSSRWHILKRFL